ncbi:hypothetical protein Lfu02_71350 [Longispora fulva]|uniref:Uncharacterized protein n=1 Tax=Longispora fulva TaxID=619741 RepID=A0A8J7GZF6_9ACTN|nr:hypothetical protein [Longispora fulva]MBG6141241.1 hypothetical protein [Longispora fulva]GIG62763.1 hypothetical protein Lfu02_71350 [Longispora fulva]
MMPAGANLGGRTAGCGAAFVFYVPALVLAWMLARLLPDDLPWWGRFAVGVLVLVVFSAALLLVVSQVDHWIRTPGEQVPGRAWAFFGAGLVAGVPLAYLGSELLSRLF